MRYIFADNIIRWRLRHNLGQSEFADLLGVDRQRVNSWESGICYPKVSMMLKLCDLIGYKDIYKLVTEKITL